MERSVKKIDNNDHPCFSREASRVFGRVHLPVAPRCNIRCNYCNRRFDCANECRPGVTSQVMSPEEALTYLERAMAAGPITVAGIAGPGDALANPERTFRTLSLVKQRYPFLLRCLSTNGLAAPAFIEEIAGAATHVTLTVNAVSDEVGARIYKWARVGKRVYTGADAAALLRERQLETIRRLKQSGMVIKVNTVVIPQVNEHHVMDIARAMEKLSVDMFNAMPLIPVAGTAFSHLSEPSPGSMDIMRALAGNFLPQMGHCARCRSDAAGLLDGAAESRAAGTRKEEMPAGAPPARNALRNCACPE